MLLHAVEYSGNKQYFSFRDIAIPLNASLYKKLCVSCFPNKRIEQNGANKSCELLGKVVVFHILNGVKTKKEC